MLLDCDSLCIWLFLKDFIEPNSNVYICCYSVFHCESILLCYCTFNGSFHPREGLVTVKFFLIFVDMVPLYLYYGLITFLNRWEIYLYCMFQIKLWINIFGLWDLLATVDIFYKSVIPACSIFSFTLYASIL